MITIRKSEERGHADHGWLNTHHTFSFAGYHDPAHMGFRSLRVLNDDTIGPGRGFGAHAHRDMEIVTYVLEGKLQHKDSMGERHVFGPNTIQAMSAGTGVVHSEFNASQIEPVHLLQIWILPEAEDFDPSYQEIPFEPAEKYGKLRLIAGPAKDANGAAARIHQDARVYACVLEQSQTVTHRIEPGRFAWVQVASGSISVNGKTLAHGDGASIAEETDFTFAGLGPLENEFLFFDLA
jgi:redox-sensitive bicupin YhaK (pirin superfamily)